MENIKILLKLAACAAFVSCDSTVSEVLIDPSSVDYTFTDFTVVQGSLDEFLTRSEAATKNYSLLAVDVVDGTCVQSVVRNQLPESEALADLQLSLSIGTHDIYFVCGSNHWDSFDEKSLLVAWDDSTAALSNVWTSHLEVSVVAGAEQSRSVDLQRAVSLVMTYITDSLPSNVCSFRNTLTGGTWTYNLSKMSGDIAATITRTVSVPESRRGTTGFQTGIYTFVPSTGSVADSFESSALNASSEAVATHTFSSVPLEVNRYTMYKGDFFHSDASFTFSLQGDWGEPIEINF